MKEKKYNDFRDLEMWQLCCQIRRDIWNIVKTFPMEEKFRLTDQLVRASRSSTACIAEGYGRYHYQENIQFCRQARGSLFELIDHFTVAYECEYISQENLEQNIFNIKLAIKKINGYIKYLQKRKSADG